MHRLLAAVALSSCLALPLAAAHAQSPAEARAEAALAQLSARYQQIWSTLTPAQRQAFSASERRWLHGQRYDEERTCRGTQPAAERAAECRGSVLQRRLDELTPVQAGALSAGSRRPA
jgi:Ni/Co efflux regulator RcnB